MRTFLFLLTYLLCACSPGQGVLGVECDTGCLDTGVSTGTGTGTGSTTTTAPLTWASVSAGAIHACALDSAGTAYCWGGDTDGQVADTPLDQTFAVIEAGGFTTWALDANGNLSSWGEYVSGVPAGPFASVSASGAMTCGILAADNSIECWTANPGVSEDLLTPPAGSFTAVATYVNTACALDFAGFATCWGLDDYGVVSGTPANIAFTSIGAGVSRACGLRADDSTVVCWGDSAGDEPSGTFTDVRAWGDTACGLRTDGTIECWGIDLGSTPPAGAWDSFSLGVGFACALQPDEIACWGNDSNGQVGLAPVGAP